MHINETRMKLKIFPVLVAAAFVVAGCSTPTHVNKGPIKATTFSFLRTGPLPEAAFRDNRQQANAFVQQAITSTLAAKGVTLAAQGGDVTVAYLIIIGNNVSTTAINDYFGYSADAVALEDKAQKAYTEGKQRGYFEAGTLLIDIVDPHTNKVLARNYVTRPLLKDASMEVREANIQQAVNEALQGVRFER